MTSRVAVIDVGSNSIKALVAAPAAGPFGLEVIFEKTLEVRISQGIGGEPPMLREDRIEAGVNAVHQLWKDCERTGRLSAARIVATSAVRSAANGDRFTKGVARVTGLMPQVLTGSEEADAIAMGVRTDPAVEDHLADFTVFDLGGGSLEIICFEHHGVTNRTSLPLGAVRLTEQFLDDPAQPIPQANLDKLAAHLRNRIEATGIRLRPPLVGCSGGLAALRKILSHRQAPLPFKEGAFLERKAIEQLAVEISSLDIGARRAIPGMPPERADIFPAAMTVFRVVLELSGADGVLHSLHNLRYGLALRLLQGEVSG